MFVTAASNVNNWHWSEQDLAGWAKKRLTELLVGIAAEGVPNKGYVKVTKLETCTGEASLTNRKGKRIVAYELNVKCKWEGQYDYDDVSGELFCRTSLRTSRTAPTRSNGP